jgi:hypothetical protein
VRFQRTMEGFGVQWKVLEDNVRFPSNSCSLFLTCCNNSPCQHRPNCTASGNAGKLSLSCLKKRKHLGPLLHQEMQAPPTYTASGNTISSCLICISKCKLLLPILQQQRDQTIRQGSHQRAGQSDSLPPEKSKKPSPQPSCGTLRQLC